MIRTPLCFGLATAILLASSACSSSNGDGGSSGGASSGGASNGGASSGGAATGGSATSGGTSATAGTTSGGGAGGGAGAGTGMRPTDVPASESLDDIRAFLENERYKQPPWVSDGDAPREGKQGSQHDGPVRVWENATLANALKAGRDGRNGHPFPDQWSMAVKELYDGTGNLVGRAAAFKQGPETTLSFGAWTYFCYGPGTRCASSSATIDSPIYGNGAKSPGMMCGICHGASIFTVPQ